MKRKRKIVRNFAAAIDEYEDKDIIRIKKQRGVITDRELIRDWIRDDKAYFFGENNSCRNNKVVKNADAAR